MNEGREDTQETRHTAAADGGQKAGPEGPREPIVRIDPERRLGRGLVVLAVVAGVLLAVFIVLGLHSRSVADAKLETATEEAAVLSVAVVEPAGGAAGMEIRLPANTTAYIDTPIYARTSGYLRRWYYDIGAHVKKGAVLAEIETPELDQQVNQARADLATAKANQQIAEITAERWKKLLAKNAVSKQETDQALSDYSARQSALSAAEANLHRLEQLQQFEKVYAPFDGVVTVRNIDVGSLIQAGENSSARQELFHMGALDKLRLYVPVPEVYMGSIRNGEQVEVTSDAYPNEKFSGTVVRNANAIDMQARTLNVEVDVLNRDHRLLPGQYAFAHFRLPGGTGTMTLPANTLLFRAEGLKVGVVRDGKAEIVPVDIGRDYGSTVEIVSGLKAGEQVIVNPPDSLVSGEKVRVERGAGRGAEK